jgi:hypothetical protein
MQSLSTFICVCNDGVLPVTLNRRPTLSHHIPLQQAETRSRLLLGPGIGAGGLERHEDVVA